MELQFNKSVCSTLRKAVSQLQAQEQTQEVRISDGMPDIGRVLGCWGQVLIRSKEWRSGGMSVSGGVMAWVLYAPEDGSEPKSIDTWIPFQMKWDFPDTQRDGMVWVMPRIKSMDCRSVSARKVMIRAGISVMGQALEPVDMEVFAPETVPEDIQLLRNTYPMEMPREAGEKHFQMEEEVALSAGTAPVSKVIRYEIRPEVTEQKVMAGKLVFHGMCRMHLMYASEDGSLHTTDVQLPFSQFADLDREYGPNASGWIVIVPTGMELEKSEDGKLMLKCGLAAQYVIYDRNMIEVVEDAYSPRRNINVQRSVLRLPVRLDSKRAEMEYSHSLRADGQKAVDVSVFWDNPVVRQSGECAEAEIYGQYQMLYLDNSESLQGVSGRSDEKWILPSDRDNSVLLSIMPDIPAAVFHSEGADVSGTLRLDASVMTEQILPMVTGLEFGDMEEPDPNRPSLILRKTGESRLWDLAKECGSTVDAIYKANELQSEPESDRILLIPVS